jgi:hypothetical protein
MTRLCLNLLDILDPPWRAPVFQNKVNLSWCQLVTLALSFLMVDSKVGNDSTIEVQPTLLVTDETVHKPPGSDKKQNEQITIQSQLDEPKEITKISPAPLVELKTPAQPKKCEKVPMKDETALPQLFLIDLIIYTMSFCSNTSSDGIYIG